MNVSNFIVLIGLVFFISCGKQSPVEKQKRAIVKQWIGKELIVPTNLACLKEYESKRKENGTTTASYGFVHFIDGACESCIRELNYLESFLTEIKVHLDITVIVSSSMPKFTKGLIDKADFQFPVCIDSLNLFNMKNRFNSNLKTFLIDSKNRIKLIGELKDEKFRKEILRKMPKP